MSASANSLWKKMLKRKQPPLKDAPLSIQVTTSFQKKLSSDGVLFSPVTAATALPPMAAVLDVDAPWQHDTTKPKIAQPTLGAVSAEEGEPSQAQRVLAIDQTIDAQLKSTFGF